MGPKKKTKSRLAKGKEKDKAEDGPEGEGKDSKAVALDQKSLKNDQGKSPLGLLIEHLHKSGRLQRLHLTLTTQEDLKCVIGTELTDRNIYIAIPKETILEDIYNKQSSSDFNSVKRPLMEYEDEEVLMIYDRSKNDEDSILICLDAFGKQLFLTGIARMKYPDIGEMFLSEVEMSSLYSSLRLEPQPKQPVDSEVEEQDAHDIAPAVKNTFIVTAESVGGRLRPVDLKQSMPQYTGFTSYDDSSFIAMRKTQHTETQCSTEIKEHSMQTAYAVGQNSWVQYEARTMSEEEGNSLLASDEMNSFFTAAAPLMLDALEDNELFDLFEDKRKISKGDEAYGDPTKKNNIPICQFFQNQQMNKGKQVACIVSHPDIKDVIAVSCCKSNPDEEQSRQSMLVNTVALWNISDPFQPKALLECPEDITSLSFYTHHFYEKMDRENQRVKKTLCLIVGSCASGKIFIWDLTVHMFCLLKQSERTSSPSKDITRWSFFSHELASETFSLRPTELVSTEEGHTSPILKIFVVSPPKIQLNAETLDKISSSTAGSFQLLTFGSDGEFILWDIDLHGHMNLILKVKTVYEIPTDVSFTAISFKGIRDGGPDFNKKILLGTESGDVLVCFWELTKEETDEKPYSLDASSIGHVHSGPIKTIEYSPFLHLFLTLGGIEIALWDDKKNTPLMVNICIGSPSVGQWSVSRPAVFFLGREDGMLEFWDMLQDLSSPFHTQIVSDAALTSLAVVDSLLAAGDGNGHVVFFRMPDELHLRDDKETEALKSCLKLDEQQHRLNPLKKPYLELESDAIIKEENANIKDYEEYKKLENEILKLIISS